MSDLCLGVDAGNSKTVALVGTPAGEVLGWGRAGNGDVYGARSPEDAVSAVVSAVRSALSMAGASARDLATGAFRLAGVDWPEDVELWRAAVERHLPGMGAVSVLNDGFAVLRCAALDGVGVAVAAGTGAAVAARGPGGREVSASFWIKELLGGTGLGDAACTAVVKAEFGTGPETLLREELLALHGARDVAELLWMFTRREHPLPELEHARAARAVLRLAEGAEPVDPVAREIVEAQARSFARCAAATARRAGFALGNRDGTREIETTGSTGDAVPVVLAGSLLTSEHPALREALLRCLVEDVPGVRVAAVGGSPVAGALLDAIGESGTAVDAALRDRVVSAPVPADLLVTA